MRIAAVLAAVSMSLCGCGGGGGSSSGDPDTVTLTPQPYSKNLGSSYEASRTALWVAEPEDNCLAVGYADFDGDRREDYVCGTVTGTPSSSAIKIYSRGVTGEVWSDIAADVFSGPVMETVHARKVVIADFNGDARPDLLIADHGYDQPPFPGAPLRLALSQSDGRLKVVDTSYAVNGFYHAAGAADINADGLVDIVATDNFHGGLLILMNDGQGSFTVDAGRLPATFTGPGRAAFTVELVDVDRDGAVDILAGGHDDQSAGTMAPTIFWNDGRGYFKDDSSTILPYPAGYGITLDFDVADLNGDNSMEVVMNHTTLSPFYQGFRWSAVSFDGRTAADASARWFGSVFDHGLGQCSGNCWTPETNWTKWLKLVDHDGDGMTDLLVTDKNRNLLFKNTGTALVRQ